MLTAVLSKLNLKYKYYLKNNSKNIFLKFCIHLASLKENRTNSVSIRKLIVYTGDSNPQPLDCGSVAHLYQMLSHLNKTCSVYVRN